MSLVGLRQADEWGLLRHASNASYSPKTGYRLAFRCGGTRHDRGNWETCCSSPIAATASHGVVVGVVTNNQDPDGLGRVKVKFPWLSDGVRATGAPGLTDGWQGRGLHLLPEVDDEVLVVFEQGQLDRPFIIGALWNGEEMIPDRETMTQEQPADVEVAQHIP